MKNSEPSPCCCSTTSLAPEPEPPRTDLAWIDGVVDTPAGPVPRVRTTLTGADRIGTWKVRWGIGRGRYLVEPGLYAVGSPTADAPVLVSANYKMSFDVLRSQLAGRDAWILVLDTKGINVWCAAGKGTFGTEELLHRIDAARLEHVIEHRKLIVPQLGATGVSAYRVKAASDFRVTFGPVRASDLPAFLDAGNKATAAMRSVSFGLAERCVLIPVELIPAVKFGLLAAVVLTLLSGLGPGGFSLSRVLSPGLSSGTILLGAWIAGVVAVPLLLPWLPGRSFSLKGVWIGLILAIAIGWSLHVRGESAPNWIAAVSWLLMVPAVMSFVAMNFTGSSTFTSLSGVLREMRVAIPFQIGSAAAGLILWLVSLYM